ncbi:MAG: DUF4405 domain-containing protein, partial [Puniceicoccales bacterium]
MKATTETTLRRILNLALYWTTCLLIASGLIMKFRFPHGSAKKGTSILNLCHHQWGEIHLWAGIAFIAFLLLHLWLARKWLFKIAARKKTWPILAGLSLGILLILALL